MTLILVLNYREIMEKLRKNYGKILNCGKKGKPVPFIQEDRQIEGESCRRAAIQLE